MNVFSMPQSEIIKYKFNIHQIVLLEDDKFKSLVVFLTYLNVIDDRNDLVNKK